MRVPGNRPLLAWLSVASLAFGTFVMVSAEFLPIGLLSPIARDLGVSEGTAGLMVTTPGFAAALAAPAASFGLQRVDRRRVLLGLTALVLASTVLSAFVASFGALLVARLLLGIAVGGFWAFAGAVARRLVDERHGATATAIVMAGIALGTVAGLPLGTVIGDLASWRRAFEAGAAMAAADALSLDEMLDNISLYWFTDTAASSARIYWENARHGGGFDAGVIDLPMAATIFPKEIYRAPKAWAQAHWPNLLYWNEVDRGGHFAAFEQPRLFCEELRKAFRSVRA